MFGALEIHRNRRIFGNRLKAYSSQNCSIVSFCKVNDITISCVSEIRVYCLFKFGDLKFVQVISFFRLVRSSSKSLLVFSVPHSGQYRRIVCAFTLWKYSFYSACLFRYHRSVCVCVRAYVLCHTLYTQRFFFSPARKFVFRECLLETDRVWLWPVNIFSKIKKNNNKQQNINQKHTHTHMHKWFSLCIAEIENMCVRVCVCGHSSTPID